MQFVFELEIPWATAAILSQLDGSYGDLSVQKHSSNVVERILKCTGEEHCHRVVQELIDSPRLDQIMQDPFGNYVIQAALVHTKVLTCIILWHLIVLQISLYAYCLKDRERR